MRVSVVFCTIYHPHEKSTFAAGSRRDDYWTCSTRRISAPRRRIDTPIEDCESGRQSATSGLKKFENHGGIFLGVSLNNFGTTWKCVLKSFESRTDRQKVLKRGQLCEIIDITIDFMLKDGGDMSF